MKSRDGFEVVNALMREEVNRRAVLRMLGASAVGLAGGLPLAAPAHAQKRKYGGELFPADWPADAHGTSFLHFFQRDRVTGRPKGIIAIDLGGLP